jgi:hypothetical protein
VQKSNFQEKSRKILQKSYFTRKPTEPEYKTERGREAATPPGDAAQAWPRQGVVRPPNRLLESSFRLQIPFDLKLSGVGHFSQIDFRCTATIRNHDLELETPFWHPAGTGIQRRSSSSSSPVTPHFL